MTTVTPLSRNVPMTSRNRGDDSSSEGFGGRGPTGSTANVSSSGTGCRASTAAASPMIREVSPILSATPNSSWSRGCPKSASTNTTRRPARAIKTARLAAVVVEPSPRVGAATCTTLPSPSTPTNCSVVRTVR